MSIGWQFLSRAVAHEPIQIVIPACCGIVTAGPYPYSAYGAPILASTFSSAAAMATGLSQAARLNGEATRVLCWAGDGGTYDIGMATLSAAAERNENILYICYDNEIYGNTGGQRSGATPTGAVTTTTPRGKIQRKKDIVGILAAHGIPYAATISLAHPEDAIAKIKRKGLYLIDQVVNLAGGVNAASALQDEIWIQIAAEGVEDSASSNNTAGAPVGNAVDPGSPLYLPLIQR